MSKRMPTSSKTVSKTLLQYKILLTLIALTITALRLQKILYFCSYRTMLVMAHTYTSTTENIIFQIFKESIFESQKIRFTKYIF